MSSENERPTPPPAPTKHRDPWRVFGIAVIVLVLIGGAIGIGYALGTSGDDTPNPEAATTSTTSMETATTSDRESEEFQFAAEIKQRLDGILTTFYSSDGANLIVTFDGRKEKLSNALNAEDWNCEELGNANREYLEARAALPLDELDALLDEITEFGEHPPEGTIDSRAAVLAASDE